VLYLFARSSSNRREDGAAAEEEVDVDPTKRCGAAVPKALPVVTRRRTDVLRLRAAGWGDAALIVLLVSKRPMVFALDLCPPVAIPGRLCGSTSNIFAILACVHSILRSTE